MIHLHCLKTTMHDEFFVCFFVSIRGIHSYNFLIDLNPIYKEE